MPIEPIERTETTAFKEREKTINKVNEIIGVINDMPEPIEYVQGEHINITDNVISQVDIPEPIEYTQGEHIDITDNVISQTDIPEPIVYTQGEHIDITNNVISQTDIPQELTFSNQFAKTARNRVDLTGNQLFHYEIENVNELSQKLNDLEINKKVFLKMEGTFIEGSTTYTITFESVLIKIDATNFNCSNILKVNANPGGISQYYAGNIELLDWSLNLYKFTYLPSSGIQYWEFALESATQDLIGWYDE